MDLLAPRHVESSWTSDQTCVFCIGRQILNHWTTREALPFLFISTIYLVDIVNVPKALQITVVDTVQHVCFWYFIGREETRAQRQGTVCQMSPVSGAEARMFIRVARLPHGNWPCGHSDSTRNCDQVAIVTLFISFMEIYNNVEIAVMATAV